jgi:hypothetical protein
MLGQAKPVGMPARGGEVTEGTGDGHYDCKAGKEGEGDSERGGERHGMIFRLRSRGKRRVEGMCHRM